MKPAQIVSLVATALLVALGVALKFSSLFPSASLPYLALTAGVGGALATRLLPPFLPSMLPAHVEQVLSQIVGAALATLGVLAPVLSSMPGAPHGLVTWIGFATALVGALGAAILPHALPVSPLPASGAAKQIAGGPQRGYVRPPVLALLLVAGAAILTLAFAGCGGASAITVAEKSLTGADQVIAQATPVWEQYDSTHQQELVNAAKAKGTAADDLEKLLADWRQTRARVDAALLSFVSAAHAARGVLELVAAGKADASVIGPSLGILYQTAISLAQAFKAANFNLPGLDTFLGPYRPQDQGAQELPAAAALEITRTLFAWR